MFLHCCSYASSADQDAGHGELLISKQSNASSLASPLSTASAVAATSPVDSEDCDEVEVAFADAKPHPEAAGIDRFALTSGEGASSLALVSNGAAEISAAATVERSPNAEGQVVQAVGGQGDLASRLDARELARVRELQLLLQPVEIDVLLACRYLRQFSTVKHAAKMYRDSLVWREQHKMTHILSEPDMPAELEAAMADAFTMRIMDGVDFQGRPILFVAIGSLDLPALNYRGVSLEQLCRRHARESERMFYTVSNSADPLKGYTAILNLTGCTISKFLRAWRFWYIIATVGEQIYPELMGRTLCINAPSAAEWAFGTIKNVIDKKTAERVSLHSVQGSFQALAALMPDELIPKDALEDRGPAETS